MGASLQVEQMDINLCSPLQPNPATVREEEPIFADPCYSHGVDCRDYNLKCDKEFTLEREIESVKEMRPMQMATLGSVSSERISAWSHQGDTSNGYGAVQRSFSSSFSPSFTPKQKPSYAADTPEGDLVRLEDDRKAFALCEGEAAAEQAEVLRLQEQLSGKFALTPRQAASYGKMARMSRLQRQTNHARTRESAKRAEKEALEVQMNAEIALRDDRIRELEDLLARVNVHKKNPGGAQPAANEDLLARVNVHKKNPGGAQPAANEARLQAPNPWGFPAEPLVELKPVEPAAQLDLPNPWGFPRESLAEPQPVEPAWAAQESDPSIIATIAPDLAWPTVDTSSLVPQVLLPEPTPRLKDPVDSSVAPPAMPLAPLPGLEKQQTELLPEDVAIGIVWVDSSPDEAGTLTMVAAI